MSYEYCDGNKFACPSWFTRPDGSSMSIEETETELNSLLNRRDEAVALLRRFDSMGSYAEWLGVFSDTRDYLQKLDAESEGGMADEWDYKAPKPQFDQKYVMVTPEYLAELREALRKSNELIGYLQPFITNRIIAKINSFHGRCLSHDLIDNQITENEKRIRGE